jgi:UDP-glucose 4-epimerase
MKCIVTGGAGFIGSHLTERLLAEGHSVTVIDNFVTGRPQNLAAFRDSPKFKLLTADISDAQAITTAFANVDWVFHLAALADIVPSMERPLDYFRCNVQGTMNMVEASRNAGIKRFIYAASSSCYGIPDVYPTPETAEMKPQYPYALTKYLGEQIVMHWAKIYRLPAISLRMFNVYGPRSRTSGVYGAVFGVFLAQKLKNKPFTVVGDGTQTRDFTFVTDVASAFVAAAKSSVSDEIMNVGSGNTYIVNLLAKLLGGEITYIPKRPGEPDCTQADIGKIRRLLGWETNVTFENGVKIMLDNIGYWQDAPVWTPESIKMLGGHLQSVPCCRWAR